MIYKNKTYLITGGTGFLGHALIKRLYGKCKIRVFARNEGKLIELKSQYPDIEILTGSLDNNFEVEQAVKGCDAIFHLGAFKHVGMAETQAYECVASNVVGTINVCLNALKYDVDYVFGISTDKAAQVNGVYGATKLLMEQMFKQFEQLSERTGFRIVRYGNVLGSTGSVVTKWIPLVKEGKEVVVSDENATRFYWSVEQAVDLIFECMRVATDSTPYVPKMKGMRVGDLLQAVWLKYGKNKPLNIKRIGLQKGENMHEIIEKDGLRSNEVEQYSVNEIMEMI